MTTAAAGTAAPETTPAAAAATTTTDAATAAAATAAAAAASTTGAPAAAAAATAPATAAETIIAPPARVVPDKYELKLPANGPLDDNDVAAIVEIATTHKLTLEEAQAALDGMAVDVAKTHEKFKTALLAHPEVGGANLEVSQANALKAMDKFCPANTPEGEQLRTALNKSGYGNYPPLMVLLSRIGKAMGEDAPAVGSTTQTGVTRDAATVLYGAK